MDILLDRYMMAEEWAPKRKPAPEKRARADRRSEAKPGRGSGAGKPDSKAAPGRRRYSSGKIIT